MRFRPRTSLRTGLVPNPGLRSGTLAHYRYIVSSALGLLAINCITTSCVFADVLKSQFCEQYATPKHGGTTSIRCNVFVYSYSYVPRQLTSAAGESWENTASFAEYWEPTFLCRRKRLERGASGSLLWFLRCRMPACLTVAVML